MRKGRSQRKSHGTRAPMSSKPLQASAGGPQLVIGLTAPQSDDRETRETRGSDADRAGDRAGGGGEVAANLSLQLRGMADKPVPVTTQIGIPQLLSEAERLEVVRENSLEIVRETLQDVRESLASAPPEALATATWVDQLKPVVEAEEEPATIAEPPAAVAAVATEVSETTGQEREEPTMMSAPNELPAVEASAPRPDDTLIPAAPDTDRSLPAAGDELEDGSLAAQVLPADEISIAPVVTTHATGHGRGLAAEPAAEEFFSQGEIDTTGTGNDEDDWDDVRNKAKRKSLPHVVERRARFAKYVRWAVSGAAVVCLAAVGVSVIPRRSTPVKAAAVLEAPVAKAAAQAPMAAAPVAAPVGAPVTAPVTGPTFTFGAADTKLYGDTPTTAAPATSAPATEPATAAPAAPVSDKTAEEEKKDSRKALERRKLGEAIEAGERSVALDPSDGEAWLLLGAAYQDKGNIVDARRCYKACVAEGKRGPLNECRKMARW